MRRPDGRPRDRDPQERAGSPGARLTHLRDWLRTGLWFVPGLFALAAVAVAAGTLILDRLLHAEPSWLAFGGGATSAELILSTIATSMMTFTGLVFTITIVALQLASSQFSPRVLRAFLRDRGSQVPLGIFAATFVYALIVLLEVRTGVVGTPFVPGISIAMAFGLVLVSLSTFVHYVSHIAQSIRAVNVFEAVAHETRRAIDENYPPGTAPPARTPGRGPCDQVIVLGQPGGVIRGIDTGALVRLAARRDCVIWMRPAVGDFVAQGAPVFEVRGASPVAARELLAHFDVGRERTMYQDPAFGFRSWSTSQKGPCRPRSTTPRPPCRRSTGCTTCCCGSLRVPTRPASTPTMPGTSASSSRSSAGSHS